MPSSQTSLFGWLWNALPSSDVVIFYGSVSVIAAFIGVLIYYAFVRRNPLTIDTFVKNNKYAVVNGQTVAVFCTTVMLTVAYYTFYKPAQNQPPPPPSATAAGSGEYDPAFKITMFAFLACLAYVLDQSYSMLDWSMTNTPREDIDAT